MDELSPDQWVAWRQHLHAHPEVSGQEAQTAAYVTAILQRLQPDELLTGLGGHGVLAAFRGAAPGPALLFRAELDALPIPEALELPYRSQHPGVSHKCGHDGHMAILLGLGSRLARSRPPRGTVYLLFQPAEEDGFGAQAVLDDPRFEPIQPDHVFALHNLPGYPLGSVLVRAGAFTATVHSLEVRLRGRTAHAAEPENGISPAPVLAELLQLAPTLEQPDPDRADFALLTPVHVSMGELSYGVAAGHGAMHFTLRSWTQEVLEAVGNRFLDSAQKRADHYGLGLESAWTNPFAANFNAVDAVHTIVQSAKNAHCAILRPDRPFKWGEDFGLFTQRFSGAMFGLGAGQRTAPLHHPDYDFPDPLIERGVRLFEGIYDALLKIH